MHDNEHMKHIAESIQKDKTKSALTSSVFAVFGYCKFICFASASFLVFEQAACVLGLARAYPLG